MCFLFPICLANYHSEAHSKHYCFLWEALSTPSIPHTE